jgi:hypothetical protein
LDNDLHPALHACVRRARWKKFFCSVAWYDGQVISE